MRKKKKSPSEKNKSLTGFTPLETTPLKDSLDALASSSTSRSGPERVRSLTGFTLIEMLVVVAVIGILSSVLLTALGPARDKAKDSRIIQEISQVRSLAETLYDGAYVNLENLPAGPIDPVIQNSLLRELYTDIKKQGGRLVIKKSADNNKYAVYSSLNTGVEEDGVLKTNYYCVDSGGRAIYTVNENDLGRQDLTSCP